MLARGWAITNIIINVIKFNSKDTGIILNIIFLLERFGAATNFDMATGKENVAIVMNKPNVGVISEYKPNPSTPICLVIIIFNRNPKNLDRNPPVNNISVPITNLFSFIFFIMINIMQEFIFYC